MTTLQDLLVQKEALERQIEQTKRAERADAIAKVRALMSEHGLSMADLGARQPAVRSGAGKGGKVAPKYRDKTTGDTWSGRGLQPKWLKAALASGKKIGDFTI